MPSPVGHMLGGVLAGESVARGTSWRMLALFAMAGAFPDIDILLPIEHRGPSHSLGAAVLVFGGVFIGLSVRRARGEAVRMALAVALAYASHTLLDWLGQDGWEPRGLMVLWPLSSAHHISDIDLFHGVTRRYGIPGFWQTNAVAVVREVAILGPPVALLTWFRRKGAVTSA